MPRKLIVAPFILLCVALASCGGTDSGGPGPDLTAPTVSQMSITDGETDVGLVAKISVTFSEPMDPATVNDTTFVVAGRSATGYVEYDEGSRTASFLPDTLLAVETWHNLVITDDVTDDAGNHYEGGTTSFQTGAVNCDNLLDHLEPDNDIPGATPLGLNEWVHTLTQCEGRADYDYFQFTLAETAKVYAKATLKECIEDLGWVTEFRRDDGELYVDSGSSASPGETRGCQFTFLPGTYWVDVYATDSEPWEFALYDFMLETRPPCRDDEFEDNDFIDECAQVQPNQDYDLINCFVDSDWFWVNLTAGQTLTVTVTSDVSTNRRLRLRDTAQTEVAFYNGSDDPASVSHTATESGPHFIMARFWSDGTEYEMNVGVE
jgi:hypothetical protein